MKQNVYLEQAWATPTEQLVLDVTGTNLKASLFRYPSGVAALRVRNTHGEMTVLPWQGQQIWQARFHGRELTMKTMFDQPYPTQQYLNTYGALLIHCGATAIGPPGPNDDNPLHGELPNAPFINAVVSIANDERGNYIEVSGTYRYTVAFSTNYLATMRLRLYENESTITVNVDVHNQKKTSMELMYLSHINFRPIDNATLHYSATKTPEHVRVRTTIPSHIKTPDGFKEFIGQLEQKPELHHQLLPDTGYDPEVVFYIDCISDDEGLAYNVQRHPDGSADFVSHRPSELPCCIRWISRTPDQDCFGLASPATSEVEGVSAERQKGNVIELAGGDVFSCRYTFGYLAPEDASALIARIDNMCPPVTA